MNLKRLEAQKRWQASQVALLERIERNMDEILYYLCDAMGYPDRDYAFQVIGDLANKYGWHPYEVIRRLDLGHPALRSYTRKNATTNTSLDW